MFSAHFSAISQPCRVMFRRSLCLAAGVNILSLSLLGCGGKQARFATPDAAAQALIAAVRAEDKPQLRSILGGDSDEILSSGDDIADQNARETFLQAYAEKSSVQEIGDGAYALRVGNDDWPLPIPIVQRGSEWQFDCQRGREEILNRRIGTNELYTMQVCRAIVDAQKEYRADDPDADGVSEFAARFISEPGMKNGLYWETAEGESLSPLGPLAAAASAEGYAIDNTRTSEPGAYHGYHYRMLTEQGEHAAGGARSFIENGNMTHGFAAVAWPAEYGNSGVMTFLVSHHGLVYEQDLGRRTESIAKDIRAFDPDSGWLLAE